MSYDMGIALLEMTNICITYKNMSRLPSQSTKRSEQSQLFIFVFL